VIQSRFITYTSDFDGGAMINLLPSKVSEPPRHVGSVLHHLTSIFPDLAVIRTPLNGLYMTSPNTFSWSTLRPEKQWLGMLNETLNAGEGVGRASLNNQY
jgi:hypothetical protein